MCVSILGMFTYCGQQQFNKDWMNCHNSGNALAVLSRPRVNNIYTLGLGAYAVGQMRDTMPKCDV